MQKYLNIDPMDGAGALQESAGLLGANIDEEAPSVLTLQSMPDTGTGTGTSNGPGVSGGGGSGSGSSTSPMGSVTRAPMFGSPGPVIPSSSSSTSSGYVPPATSSAFSEIHGGGVGEEGMSMNPLSFSAHGPSQQQASLASSGSRYTVPTLPVPAVGQPLSGAGSSGPPSALASAASKSKKAMKEPKSMRSST